MTPLQIRLASVQALSSTVPFVVQPKKTTTNLSFVLLAVACATAPESVKRSTGRLTRSTARGCNEQRLLIISEQFDIVLLVSFVGFLYTFGPSILPHHQRYFYLIKKVCNFTTFPLQWYTILLGSSQLEQLYWLLCVSAFYFFSSR